MLIPATYRISLCPLPQGCPAHGLRIISTSPKKVQLAVSFACAPHLASIVDDAEISFVLQLLGLLKLGVSALLLHHLLHKALVGSFGEPALLIQQGQDARRARLEKEQRHTGE